MAEKQSPQAKLALLAAWDEAPNWSQIGRRPKANRCPGGPQTDAQLSSGCRAEFSGVLAFIWGVRGIGGMFRKLQVRETLGIQVLPLIGKFANNFFLYNCHMAYIAYMDQV